MGKVGRFVTNPQAGAYCELVLDSGEKIIIIHDKGIFSGEWLTVEVSERVGLSSDRIFVCALNSPEGVAALTRLTRTAPEGSLEATPLGALVQYVMDCPSVADVRTRCTALLSR